MKATKSNWRMALEVAAKGGGMYNGQYRTVVFQYWRGKPHILPRVWTDEAIQHLPDSFFQ